MSINEQSNYYAIIPATVRYDKRLTPLECLLYGEITALTDEQGYCRLPYTYYMDLYNIDAEIIDKAMKKLLECGYIRAIENSDNQITALIPRA